jgi:hypothetical protein
VLGGRCRIYASRVRHALSVRQARRLLPSDAPGWGVRGVKSSLGGEIQTDPILHEMGRHQSISLI